MFTPFEIVYVIQIMQFPLINFDSKKDLWVVLYESTTAAFMSLLQSHQERRQEPHKVASGQIQSTLSGLPAA